MNPYQSRNAVVRPRPVTVPLAGRLLRTVSTGIDFVVLLTLRFAICSYFPEDEELDALCTFVPMAILLVYEVGLATSVAKQLLGLKVHFDYPGFRFRLYRALLKYCFIPIVVFPFVYFTARRQGLHDKVARTVVVQPNGWTAWARATIGVLLAGYAMLTFGCGALLSTAIQEKYNHRVVNLELERWEPPAVGREPENWHSLWVYGARAGLPGELDGLPLRGSPSMYFYNASEGPKLEGPRVVAIFSPEDGVRAALCEIDSPGLEFLLPCHLSPREFQKAILETTTEAQWFLNPKTLVGENAKRVVKNLLLKGDEVVELRLFEGPEFSVAWYAIAHYDDDGNVTMVVDNLNLGGETAKDELSVSLFWSNHERSEAMVETLAATLAFDGGSEELAASLLETALRQRSPLPLLSAIHLAEDKRPAAEALYLMYERASGAGFEKRLFALWVSDRIESGDLSLMDLNERVWDWRGDEGSE